MTNASWSPSDGIAPDPSSEAGEAVRSAVRFWWISVLRGCLGLFLGMGALFTKADQSTLVNFIGVYWLLTGLMTTRWAIGIRWKAGSRIGLAAGVLGIATGVVLLVREAFGGVLGETVIIGIVALTVGAVGCLRLVGAFEIEEHAGHRWTIGGIVLGSVEVILGVILFIARDADASTVRTLLGVWGLVAGVLLLLQGTRMLRARRATL
jgi:uncharacterized membrane protein HdeD (DUF308 family)